MSDPAPKGRLPKRITKRQRRILRARLKHPNESQKDLGSRLGMPPSNISKELSKPHVKAKLLDLMDARPALQDEALLTKLEEGLSAGKTEFFPHEITTGYEKVLDDGGNPILDAKGKPKMRAVKKLEIVTRDCVDFPTRHRYLDTALELKGHKRKKVDLTSNGNTIKSLLLEDD